MKEVLKVSGILNIIFSFTYLLLSIFKGITLFYCFIFLISSGIIYLVISKEKNIDDNKSLVLILSIISIPLCFVSALINLISLYKYNKKNSNAPNVDKDTQKLDILIKIGASLITLSGVIFIFNTWSPISGLIILFFFIILTILCYLLNYLFTYKIKLESSSKLYFYLYNLFMLLIILTIGHYNLLGDFFNSTGEGQNLYYTMFFAISSLIVYNFKKISNSDLRLYIMYILLLFCILNFLLFIKFNIIQSLVIINLIILFIKYISRNSYILEFTDFILKLFIFISGIALITKYSISLLILTLLNIIVLNHYNFTNNNKVYQLITPIISISYISILLAKLLYLYNYSIKEYILIVVSLLSIIYILIMFLQLLNKKSLCKRTFAIIYNFNLLIYTTISLFINNYTLLFIIIIRLVTLFAFYYYEYRKDTKDIEFYLIPLNILMIFISIIVYLNTYITMNINVVLLLLMILLSILYIFNNNKILNMVSIILISLLNIINILTSLFSDNYILIYLTLVSTIIPYVLLTMKNNKLLIKYSYIYILLFSYIVLLNSVFNDQVSLTLNLILYLMIYLVTMKDKKYTKWLYFAVTLPILTFINRINIFETLRILLNNFIAIYLLLCFIFLILKKLRDKKIIFMIIMSLILIIIFFKTNYIYGIYIGIVSLVILFYGFFTKDRKELFIYGLIILILNILYRLSSIWASIPLWIYLLISGLTIIIIATLKELKKSSK